MNHYSVLGISRTADQRSIRRAFREMAKRYHPDAGEGASAEHFRKVVEAHKTLGDPRRRAEYDAQLNPRHKTQVFTRTTPEPLIPSDHVIWRRHLDREDSRYRDPFAAAEELFDQIDALFDSLFWR